MTLETYKPVRLKYSEWARHYSPVTDMLIKRKRIYFFTGASVAEWEKLAEEFLVDGGILNHACCLAEAKKVKTKDEPVKPPESPEWIFPLEDVDVPMVGDSELPELPDEIFGWQKQTGMN